MDRENKFVAWQCQQVALCDAIIAGGDVLPSAVRLLREIARAAEEDDMTGFPLALASELSAKLDHVTEVVLSRSPGADVKAIRAGACCVRGVVMGFAKPGHPWADDCVQYTALLACDLEIARRHAVLNASGRRLETDVAIARPLLASRDLATALH